MFRQLRRRQRTEKPAPEPDGISASQLAQDPAASIALRHINDLPENAKMRAYRALLPSALLADFGIDPITWKGKDGELRVRLKAKSNSGTLTLTARDAADSPDDFLTIELSDNSFYSIDLSLVLLNDPNSTRFGIDTDEDGNPTLWGTAGRNLAEEERAMQAGLAPAQIRMSLGASKSVLQHLETFFNILGHRAYVRGHKLMDDIHKEFQSSGRLHQALDGSSPFRQPEQWNTVRGRAWALSG